MANKMLVVMFVFLLGTLASADFASRCPNPTGSCSATATASASAFSTGGSCAVRSVSNAYCSTFVSELESCFTASSLYGSGTCRSVRPKVDAKCFSTVAAAAYASAFVRAECTEGSIGCGSANSAADAEVVGCYTSFWLIDIANQLGTHTAECDDAVVQVVNTMARAAADAEAAACSANGVLGLDSDFSFDISVRRIISAACKKCWTYCDPTIADDAKDEPQPPPASTPPPPPPRQEKSTSQPTSSASASVSASGTGDIVTTTAAVATSSN